MIKNFEITADTTQKILKNLPHSVVPLLESWQQIYDKSLNETKKSGKSYVDNYIAKLVKLAEVLDSHVKENPVAAKEVLQSVSTISQKGYPHLYIEANFDKSPDYNLAYDNGVANCDSEIDLSSTLRNTIRSVVNADSSLLNDACTVVKNIKDCSEKVYFNGRDYNPATVENTQKRNFLQWMKNKLADNKKDIAKNELIYEKDGYFSGHTSLKYNDGNLIYRYEQLTGDSSGVGYTTATKTKSYYLSEQEQVLVEKIIETKNPNLLKKLMKAVKDDDLEMKGLAKDYLKYQRNAEKETIKEIENTPEKAVYSFGEGKDALILSIAEKTEFNEVMSPTGDPMRFSEKHLKLELSRDNEAIYNLSELVDSKFSYYKGYERNRIDVIKDLSKKLWDDNSKNSSIAKKLLSMINGNPLIDEMNKQIGLIKDAQNRELNNSKLAKVRNMVAKLADKVAEVTRTEKIVQKFTDGKKIADVEISVEKKAWEKKVSDKILGKINE